MTRINIYAKADDDYDSYDKPALLGWFDPATSEAFEQDTEWDGNNMIGVITRSQWVDESLYRTKGGKWVRNNNATRYMNGPNLFEFLTDDEARDWLLRSECNDEAIERFFGDVADEEDRRPGRPEIGGRVTMSLGELLPAIDAYAARAGFSRAAAVRQLAGYGLVTASLPVGMKPIVFECDVVTGRIEIDDADWTDEDARWRFIADPFGTGASVMGAEVEPWGEDETGMERATKAVRELGYTIDGWEGEPGGTWRATITGRA